MTLGKKRQVEEGPEEGQAQPRERGRPRGQSRQEITAAFGRTCWPGSGPDYSRASFPEITLEARDPLEGNAVTFLPHVPAPTPLRGDTGARGRGSRMPPSRAAFPVTGDALSRRRGAGPCAVPPRVQHTLPRVRQGPGSPSGTLSFGVNRTDADSSTQGVTICIVHCKLNWRISMEHYTVRASYWTINL